MAEQFYSILTSIGKAKIANANALGNKLNLTTLVLGDGNGKYYNPTENQEALVNEVWKGNISSITTDSRNPNWIVIETIIAGNVGGFFIREVGIFDDEGSLIAIGKYPETYKPVISDGSTKDLIIRMILEVSNSANVTLKIDPAIIMATKKDVEVLENKIRDLKGVYAEDLLDETVIIEGEMHPLIKSEFEKIESQMADMAQQRKTYNELKELIDNNKLVPGTQYVLTDYRTKYQQPTTNVIKEMDVEELVLTADSKNTFEPIVSSLKYPEDIVYYDFNNNICEDRTTPRNGFISKRYDQITKNDAPQDWRTMLWARWTPHPTQYLLNGVLTNYSIWTSGKAKKGVLYKADDNRLYMAYQETTPTSQTDVSVFFPLFISDSPLLISDETIIIDNVENMIIKLIKYLLVEVPTFGENCKNNTIEHRTIQGGNYNYELLHNNVFLRGSSHNTIGKESYNNTFDHSSHYNILGTDNYYNIFMSSSNGNTLNYGCQYNIFYNARENFLSNDVTKVRLGNQSNNNQFNSGCFRMFLGGDCRSNNLSGVNNFFLKNCSNNNLMGEVFNNNFGVGSQNNIIKSLKNKDVSGLTVLFGQYPTVTIETTSNNSYVYWYINSSNQMVITAIP